MHTEDYGKYLIFGTIKNYGGLGEKANEIAE